MRDEFTARVSGLAVVVAALSTLGAVIYLSVRGQQVNSIKTNLPWCTARISWWIASTSWSKARRS